MGEDHYYQDIAEELVTEEWAVEDSKILGNSCPCEGIFCDGYNRLGHLEELCHTY